MEVTTAQFWSSAGEAELEQEVEFHGVTAEPASAFIDGSAGGAHKETADAFDRLCCLRARCCMFVRALCAHLGVSALSYFA